MSGKRNLRTNFAVHSKHEAFYTGGQVLVTDDGSHILCRCTDKVNVLQVDSGTVVHSFGEEEDGEITSFTLSPDNKILVLALRNLLLKQFDFDNRELSRTWKAIHQLPVSSMTFDVTSTLLATGGTDATIKIWDVIQQYCTHNLRGHRGVVSIVKYHPDPDKLQLLSGGEDYNIRVWDLRTSVCVTCLEGHYSVITGLHFSSNMDTLYSCGRDKVINVWDMKTTTKTRTIPVYETVEGMVLLGDEDYSGLGVDSKVPHFVTAGNKGVLRVWNAHTSQCVYTQTLSRTGTEPETSDTSSDTETEVTPSGDSEETSQNITTLIHSDSLKAFITVSFDHNITLYNRNDVSLQKQFAGYNDDILSVKYLGPSETHVVVATNSELIKVFHLATWDVQIVRGHTDIVLAIDVHSNGHMFASSSKDNTIRVWMTNDDITDIRCIATAYGHTKEILSLGFSRQSAGFLVSGSEDLTMKVWNLPESLDNKTITSLNALLTEKAHDKDINSIIVSPNDKLIATGSQDKTAKLWSVSGLKLLGVFRGHKRGVWCVQFSPVDQCLATASSDGSVKIWALSDYTCIRTLEGHNALVLNVQFINRGMQLLTTGSDGLLKLWTVRTSECIKTLAEHDAKIWALAVSRDEDRVITGGADSTIIVWKDVTETEVEEDRAKQIDFILKEQKLLNFIQQKKYIKALAMAINLEQPFRVLNIMKEILSDQDDEDSLRRTLLKLRPDQIDVILRFSVQWNTNSKHCHVAQHVMRTLLTSLSPEQILELPNAKSSLEGLLPYTQKHMERMNRLQQQASFVDYTWNTMKLASRELDTESPMEVETVDLAGRLTQSTGQSQTTRQTLDDSGSESDSESDDSGPVKESKVGKESETDSSSSSDESTENVSVCVRVKARTSQTGKTGDSESESDSDEDMDIQGESVQKHKDSKVHDSGSEDSELVASGSDSDVIPSPTQSPRTVDLKPGLEHTQGKQHDNGVVSQNNIVVGATPINKKSLAEVSGRHSDLVRRRRPSDIRRHNTKRRRKSAS